MNLVLLRRSAPSRERGSVTLWVLGLVFVVLAFGGLAVDLWRGVTVRQRLVAVADAAATTGASALDVDRWRSDGVLALDPADARARAYMHVARAGLETSIDRIDATTGVVTVELVSEVPLTLLRPVVGERGIVVRGWGRAEPRLGR